MTSSGQENKLLMAAASSGSQLAPEGKAGANDFVATNFQATLMKEFKAQQEAREFQADIMREFKAQQEVLVTFKRQQDTLLHEFLDFSKKRPQNMPSTMQPAQAFSPQPNGDRIDRILETPRDTNSIPVMSDGAMPLAKEASAEPASKANTDSSPLNVFDEQEEQSEP